MVFIPVFKFSSQLMFLLVTLSLHVLSTTPSLDRADGVFGVLGDGANIAPRGRGVPSLVVCSCISGVLPIDWGLPLSPINRGLLNFHSDDSRVVTNNG